MARAFPWSPRPVSPLQLHPAFPGNSYPGCVPRQQTGDVCLHVAANKGRTELVTMLLAGGANVNLQNKVWASAHCPNQLPPSRPQRRPRSARASTGHRAVACRACTSHPSPAYSPLTARARHACLRHPPDPWARLCEVGLPRTLPLLSWASLFPWQLGQTALHCAAGYGALPVVELLVSKGADKSLTDMVRRAWHGSGLARAEGRERASALVAPRQAVLGACAVASELASATAQDGNTPCELAKNYGARAYRPPRTAQSALTAPTFVWLLAMQARMTWSLH